MPRWLRVWQIAILSITVSAALWTVVALARHDLGIAGDLAIGNVLFTMVANIPVLIWVLRVLRS